MIIIRTRIAASIMVLIAVIILFLFVKKKKIRIQDSLDWLAGAVIVEIVIIFPGVTNFLAEIMGIKNPVNMAFFAGFIVLLILVFRLSVYVSNMKNQIRILTQKIALLEKRINDCNTSADNSKISNE